MRGFFCFRFLLAVQRSYKSQQVIQKNHGGAPDPAVNESDRDARASKARIAPYRPLMQRACLVVALILGIILPAKAINQFYCGADDVYTFGSWYPDPQTAAISALTNQFGPSNPSNRDNYHAVYVGPDGVLVNGHAVMWNFCDTLEYHPDHDTECGGSAGAGHMVTCDISPFYLWDDVNHACTGGYFINPPPPPNNGLCCTATPEPIDPGSGNENWNETDYRSGDGQLTFSRTYNSSNPVASTFSTGWQSNLLGRRIMPLPGALPYRMSLSPDPASACTSGAAGATYLGNMQCQLAGGQVVPVYYTALNTPWTISNGFSGLVAQRQDGRLRFFSCSSSACAANSDVSIRLTPVYYNWSLGQYYTYNLTDNDDTVEQYDGNGNLKIVTSRNGYQQNFSYNGNSQIASVSDTLGRSLSFTYNGQGQLQIVTTPDGNIQYSYDSGGHLATVTYPDNSVRTYQYSDINNPNALTGVVDESSNPYVSTSYDAIGRAYQSGLSGNVGWSNVDYTDPSNPIVTDARGVARTYHYTTINSYQKISSISGSVTCLTCNTSAATNYDSAGYLQSTTDWNGNITQYTYDDTRGLELSRTEASGTPQARTISTTWDANFRLPDEIDEPGRRTNFTYDATGNLLTKTVKDTATNSTRTWTYSNYTAWGAPQTIDGPRTDVADVTQIAYYPIVSGDPKSGQVNTVTDALGHVTTISSYDPSGRPLTVTDPNGLVTTLTYSPRGWLTSRQAGSELTQYSYYPTGLLQQVTLPNGAYLQYSYNAAHQLTQVQDQLGDSIVYTPDAMGNNTSQKVYDPNGSLTQTRSSVYNSLNELYQSIGAQSQTTTYGYDNNGNLNSITDPLSHQTVNAYDALNRLTQVTDPASGVTHYGYNALDQLTGVTDPRSLVTAYTVDALGNTGAVQSPDSGGTAASYDAAGNVLTRTDAKNQTSQYQYDALNRLTQITRADSTVIGFSYDQGTNGIGRLTGMSDPSGTTAWSYDAHGRVLQKTQTTNGISLTTAYAYDSSGQLLSQTLPSGAVIGYTWTNGQISALKLNNAALVSGIAWQSFSGPKSWSFANGESLSRGYDQDGRVAATPVESTIGYDSASRITGITLGNQSVLSGSKTYGYDALDRLTGYTAPGASIAYGYDANGNRNQQSGEGNASTLSIDGASNRITSILEGSTPAGLSYDANGSTTADVANAYSYDASGRLSTANGASYTYNGLGQRVQKVTGTLITLYVYDEGGQLVGEYDGGSGLAINETVWLGSLPVAAIQQSGTYYIHADHLNAPRQIDNATGQAVWAWDTTTFGAGAPNQDPNGTGYPFVFNLRFPGQYYDAESGLYYNLNRYLDPTTGRYTASDPLGLAGGSFSIYIYVSGNPISLFDPTGLSGGPSGIWGSPAPARLWPIIPPIPLPEAPPAAAVAASGYIGYWIGSQFYPIIAGPLGNAIDAVCNEDSSDCEKEWQEAYEKCKKLLKDPKARKNPRQVGKLPPTLHSCATGYVTEECGGNPLD